VLLNAHYAEFPLYPRPELPDATIEAIVDARVYLVANNSGKNHTAKFRVFTEDRQFHFDDMKLILGLPIFLRK